MMFNRRTFLSTTTGAALSVTLPRGARSPLGVRKMWSPGVSPEVTTLRDPRIKALTLSALEAARAAGARYADTRVSYTRGRGFAGGGMNDQISLGLSVRALVDGYWGWAATPYLSDQEAPRVGREATRLARANATNHAPRHVEWGTTPVITDGTWSTPMRIDPFNVATDEIQDWIGTVADYIEDIGAPRGGASISDWPYCVAFGCDQQERIFASTEGSYLAQTVSVVRPNIGFQYREVLTRLYLPPVQLGWEYVTELSVQELIQREMDRIDAELAHPLPVKPFQLGRYDVILGASAMAALVGATLGTATELDRSLGYEANAGGTSYLGPNPLTDLGTTVASPLVTISADRSTPQALATVRWDEEGVTPEDFLLVKDGVLVDYQTTREQAAWLAPWYTKRGLPIRSHGCAASSDALTLPMQHTPNLTLHPGAADLGMDDLVANLEYGVVIDALRIDLDFQELNGLGFPGRVTEIRHGKRVARLTGAPGMLFHTPEFWKNITMLGGRKSVRPLYALQSSKGEPAQQTEYSVTAVPAHIQQVALIDVSRKA